MTLLKKQCSKSAVLGPSSYAPIAQAFNKMGYDEREKLRVKFNKAYFIATENLPYTKHPKIPVEVFVSEIKILIGKKLPLVA